MFRLYSMSKPITSVAALMLVEASWLSTIPYQNSSAAFADTMVGLERVGEDGQPALALEPLATDHDRGFAASYLGNDGDSGVRKLYAGGRSVQRRFDQRRTLLGECRCDGVGGTFFLIDPADDMLVIFMVQTSSRCGRISSR